MFNDNQTDLLSSPLLADRIKSRTKGNGINLSYLEGFDIIDTANLIFGFAGWEYHISTLAQVSQETNRKGNTVICYKAVVKVLVYNNEHSSYISREDVGFGTGISQGLAEAHEGAAKESVTDALKRCFRTFGNQFGNSLYDKSRKYYKNNNQRVNHQDNTNQGLPHNQQDQPNIPHHNQSNGNGNLNQSYGSSNHNQHSNQTAHRTNGNSHNGQDNGFNQYSNSNNYSELFNLGLNIVEQGSDLVVFGNDIFNKKDAIKSCGFMWDGNRKLWYKPIENGQVA
jgi:DNA repair and recombination protein RAD52